MVGSLLVSYHKCVRLLISHEEYMDFDLQNLDSFVVMLYVVCCLIYIHENG